MTGSQKRVVFFGIIAVAAAWIVVAVYLEAKEKRSSNNETDTRMLQAP